MESKQTYSRDDLLSAWLESEGARGSHPDIADHYCRQAWALAGALRSWGPRINLSYCPKEHQQLMVLFESSVRCHNRICAPWGRVLVGRHTAERAEVEALHSPAIVTAADGLRAAYRALMLDLMERIWGIGPDLTASLDAVKKSGSDPDTPAPDFDLDW